MRRFRSLAIGAITVVLLIAALFLTRLDFAAIAAAARQLSAASILIALALLVIGAFLAVARLWWISFDIGTPLSFRDAVLALSLGQVVGAISVQFFGQIAARTALLGRRGISNSANIVMATYERAAAVFVSAAMAVGGAVFLFGKLSYDLEKGGAQFLTLVAGFVFVTGVGAYAVWGRYALPSIKELLTAKIAVAILRNALITAIIQLCTAGAYVAIAWNLTGTIPLSYLFAASLVVMFAASLPISFSGWGMREISSVFVLGAVGVPSAVALTMALVVGALAFAAVIFLAGAAAPFGGAAKAAIPIDESKSFALTVFLRWVLPIAAATAVFFQIHVPTGGAELSVNLADPIALLGGLVFASEYRKNAQWRYAAIPLIAALWTLVLLLAYAHGYISFGSNSWATVNRLVGWLILLCYTLTGALIVAQAGAKGAVLFARAFAATACAVVLFWSALVLVNSAIISIPPDVLSIPLSGFSQNRNAFSFALLMTICALPLIEQRGRPLVLGTLLFGLWLAGSYAALAALIVVGAALLYLRTISWRSAALILIGVAAVILIFQMVPYANIPLVPDLAARTSSNVERISSLSGGLALFRLHPIFGAGLGHFINDHIDAGETLVIHSTPVWLLAETGLIGFSAFVIPTVMLFFREFKDRHVDPASQVILLALAAFAVMAQAHELMYQRPIWLLLGVVLVMRRGTKPASS